jgi:hypothetical protein
MDLARCVEGQTDLDGMTSTVVVGSSAISVVLVMGLILSAA